MDNVEIPAFFICPISLEIMKDPVTAVTGITYDRESIEDWLHKRHNTICPVTKQFLPKDSDLTPNNILHRLIRAWCTANSTNLLMDQVPTPKSPMSKFNFANLIRGLRVPTSQLQSLKHLERLATENESNRKQMVEGGITKPIISFILACHRKEVTTGLAEALNIFFLIRSSLSLTKIVGIENDEIIDALTWVLGCDHRHFNDPSAAKMHAIFALKMLVLKDKSISMGRLKPEFFRGIIRYVRESSKSRQGTNAALQLMLDSCSFGRNRIMMLEAKAVFELIELEFESTEKKTTELIFGILLHMCSCADGRAEFLSHSAGVAVVAKRILKVSPVVDDRAMWILSLISKFSGTIGVLQEMLRVGAVAKLCMVIQSNCESFLKEKARKTLRTHSNVWKDSPCIDIPTITGDKICQLTL